MYERVAHHHSYRNDARDNPSRHECRYRVNYRKLYMVSILSKDFVWTPAAATNIVNTFRRHGWTPPSEQAEYITKWKSFKENNHETDSLSTGQSTEIVRASTQDKF